MHVASNDVQLNLNNFFHWVSNGKLERQHEYYSKENGYSNYYIFMVMKIKNKNKRFTEVWDNQ